MIRKEEHAMPKAPKGVALIFCDRMQVDTATGELSLMGIFLGRRFRSFPTPVLQFTAFTLVTGGEGEGRMVLEIKRADSEAPIYRREKWAAFAHPDLLMMQEFPVRRCLFPSPGRYIATLTFEGDIVAQTVLDIARE
jgi:hypothetical protein